MSLQINTHAHDYSSKLFWKDMTNKHDVRATFCNPEETETDKRHLMNEIW